MSGTLVNASLLTALSHVNVSIPCGPLPATMATVRFAERWFFCSHPALHLLAGVLLQGRAFSLPPLSFGVLFALGVDSGVFILPDALGPVCSLALAALDKVPEPGTGVGGGIHNRNVLPHDSGGWRSEVMVSVGLVSSGLPPGLAGGRLLPVFLCAPVSSSPLFVFY